MANPHSACDDAIAPLRYTPFKTLSTFNPDNTQTGFVCDVNPYHSFSAAFTFSFYLEVVSLRHIQTALRILLNIPKHQLIDREYTLFFELVDQRQATVRHMLQCNHDMNVLLEHGSRDAENRTVLFLVGSSFVPRQFKTRDEIQGVDFYHVASCLPLRTYKSNNNEDYQPSPFGFMTGDRTRSLPWHAITPTPNVTCTFDGLAIMEYDHPTPESDAAKKKRDSSIQAVEIAKTIARNAGQSKITENDMRVSVRELQRDFDAVHALQNEFRTFFYSFHGRGLMMHPLWVQSNIVAWTEPVPLFFTDVYRKRDLLRSILDLAQGRNETPLGLGRRFLLQYNLGLLLMDQVNSLHGTVIITPPGCGMTHMMTIVMIMMQIDTHKNSDSDFPYFCTATEAGLYTFARTVQNLGLLIKHTMISTAPIVAKQLYVVGPELEEAVAACIKFGILGMPLVYVDDARSLTTDQWEAVFRLRVMGARIVLTGLSDSVVGQMSTLGFWNRGPVYMMNESRIIIVHPQLGIYNKRRGGLTRVTALALHAPPTSGYRLNDGGGTDAVEFDEQIAHLPWGKRTRQMSVFFITTNIRLVALPNITELADTKVITNKAAIERAHNMSWLPPKEPEPPNYKFACKSKCPLRGFMRCLALEAMRGGDLIPTQSLLQDVTTRAITFVI